MGGTPTASRWPSVRTLIGAKLIAVFLLIAPAAGAQSAVAPPAPDAGIASKVVASGPNQAAYWTEGRMRRAESLDLVRRVPLSDADPDPLAHESLNSGEVSDTVTYPNRAHGKVFFKIGTSSYVCSGTVVPSAGDDLVLTAGHCVYDAGGSNAYVKNFVFVPGYKDGEAPFGVWPAELLTTTTEWRGENFNYDIALANVAAVNGAELEDVVGAQGIAFNQPRDQAYDAFGYPAGSPFNGQRLRVCESSYFGDDPYDTAPGPPAMGIACDMTGGASGGGWVTSGGYVASVTSYGYDDLATELNHLYGPYFESVAKDLYANVDGASGTPADLVPPEGTTFQAAPDTSVEAPRLRARERQPQSGERIVVKLRAGAGEQVLGTARGRITVKGIERTFRLRAVSKSIDADQLATFRLSLKRKAHHGRIFSLLEQGRTTRSKVAIELTDGAGNNFVLRKTVRLLNV